MAFEGAAAYGRFMGRYSEPLAAVFADWVGIQTGDRVLDVGCGPGALTAELAGRLGPDRVAAIDPSAPFVAATRDRCPGVDVRSGAAETLPFADDAFDVTLAQLVVHFMADPIVGLTEMARVTAPGGVVAACVWDHSGAGGPLSVFWRAVHELDPAALGEAGLAGTHEGDLVELVRTVGLTGTEPGVLTVVVGCDRFEEWWEPYTLGVGPAGDHVAALSPTRREALRRRCAELLPAAPFEIRASAWAVRARVRSVTQP